MRKIIFSTQYKRDLKLALKRRFDEEKLNLYLIRTGTHSNLF